MRVVDVKEEDGRYRVSIDVPGEDGPREFVAEFDDAAGAVSLRVGDRSYLVEISETGGRYAACVGAHRLSGRLYTLEQRLRERLAGSLGSQKNAIEAKMPGKVLEVFVEAGAQVVEGDKIAVLEAMKMENTIRAPRAGIISTVGIAKGDNIQAGHTIAEFEETS